ncbi:MAG: von Willebrand factor type A domain-containing protein [Candidatus Poribacteria bacterium]|nr:von Willebrand factor type A domain-containing protein [Candidatus Poribacteria bacterium]
MKNGFTVYPAKFRFLVLTMLISVFLVFFTGYAEPIFLDETPNAAIKFPGGRHHYDVYLTILPRAIRPEFDRTLGSDYGIAEATLQAADAIMERHAPRVRVGVFLPNPRRLNIPDLLSYRWGVDPWRSLDRLLRWQQDEQDAKRRCLSKRQLYDVFFKGHGTNPFIDPEDDHQSTFGMDANSASYSVMRRYLRDGSLPPTEAVRVEEFINAFDYDYTPPTDDPFALYLEGAPSKFGEGKRLQLLRIGIQGRVIPDTDRKDAVLTFVIDVSSSMGYENRLGLVKKALRLLVKQLRPSDKIGIVVYGTDARVVLPHTSVVNRTHILEKINSLCPEGVTNVEDGIHEGYELARKNSQSDSINRVILCSDGVANEGVTSPKVLLKQIQDYVDDGIFLPTVGFGMGNYNDELMEALAKKGNGNYAYVDTLSEARRIFVENLTGTLQVISKDAKVQVKFNPDTVRSFRLLGYENRQMKHEDFRNDDADAGEIGSGHSVTALYEVKLNKGVDSGRLAKVSIRYEDPDTQKVTEIGEKFFVENFKGGFEDASPGLQFAATVAQFAEILRESVWAKNGCLKTVHQTLKGILQQHPEVVARGEEQVETRGKELLALVRNAKRIKDKEPEQEM